MTETDKLLVRIGTARDAISRKTEQTSLDYMIDGVLMNCSVLLKEQEHKDKMFHALEDDWKRLKGMLKEQEAVEPFHRCIGKEFSLIEDSHFDYCPYCGKPISWAKQEGR